MRINRSLLLVSVLGITVLSQPVSAQTYPDRPIRLVTMFAAGSSSDINARYVAVKLGEKLGVNLVTDIKSGAGGLIALRDVYRAQPLGYSLLIANTSLTGNVVAHKEPLYKIDDYTPVGVLGQSYYALIMHTSIPANTLAEFVNWAKANPGKINYATIGPAAGATLSAERFKKQAGIDMVGVPFRGGTEIATALLGGQVHVYWATAVTAANQMKNAQIRGLAINGDRRTAILPNMPTFKELGYPDMQVGSWSAIFAPSAIPAPMLATLRKAYAATASEAEWKARMEKVQLDPFEGTLDQFMEQIRQDARDIEEDYRRLNLPKI